MPFLSKFKLKSNNAQDTQDLTVDRYSIDWVVLSAALFATGLGIMMTVSGGLRTATAPIDAELPGSLVRTIFASEYKVVCEGGLVPLQAKEDTRAARAIAKGTPDQALDVVAWLARHGVEASESALTSHIAYLRPQAIAHDGNWNAAATKLAALECEAARRGIFDIG